MKNMAVAQRPNAGMDALGSVSVTATSHSTRYVKCVWSVGSTFLPRKSTTSSLLLKAARMKLQI